MSIREDLELDVAPALASIDDLKTALQDAVSGAGDLLATSLAGAQDALSTALLAGADASAAGLTASITDAVTAGLAAADLTGLATTAQDALGIATTDGVQTGIDGVDATPLADQLQTDVFDALSQATAAALDDPAAGQPLADSLQQSVFDALSQGGQTGLDQVDSSAFTGNLGQDLADAVSSGVQDGLDSVDTSSVSSLSSGIGQVGASAQSSFGSAAGAAKGFDIAVAGASGSLAGSAGALGSLLPGAAIIGGISAATLKWFQSGEAVHASQERLTAVFGEQAAAVQKVNIGGLTGNIADLAKQTGSAASGVRQSSASLGQFGFAANASKGEVLSTVQNVQALTLSAVAMNRDGLGPAGDAMGRLSTALLTGRAKALAPFNIALDKSVVAARAQQIAFADGRTEVTKFDTIAAAAAIATENLGNKLGKNFATGIELSNTKLAQLGATIRSAIATGAAPLVDPLIKAATELTPVAVALAGAVGGVLGTASVLAATLATDLGPGLVSTATGIEHLLQASAPAASVLGGLLGGAAQALGGILSALGVVLDHLPGPLVAGVAAFFAMQAAAGFLLPVLADVIVGITGMIGSAIASVPAFQGAGEAVLGFGSAAEEGMAAATGGITLVLAGIVAVVAAFGLFNSGGGESAATSKEVGAALTQLSGSVDGTGRKFLDLGKNVSEALDTDKLGDFGKTLKDNGAALLQSFASAGIGAKQLGHDLETGSAGMHAFVDQYVKAVKPPRDFAKALDATGFSMAQLLDGPHGLKHGGNAVDNFKKALEDLPPGTDKARDAADKYASTLQKVRDQFVQAQKDFQDGLKTQIAGLASQEQLTGAEEKQLKSGKDLSALYVELANKLQDTTAVQAEASAATANQSAFTQGLADSILRYGLSLDQIPSLAQKLGVDAKDLQDFQKQVQATLDGIVSDTASALPKTGDAITSWTQDISSAWSALDQAVKDKKPSKEVKADQDALANATDPQRIIDNLNAQRKNIEDFNNNVAALFASGNTRAAQEALKLGPQVGGQFAAGLIQGGPAIEAGANTALLGVDTAQAALLANTRDVWGPELVDEFGNISIDASGKVTEALGPPTQTALHQRLGALAKSFGADSPQFATAAAELGSSAAQSYLIAIQQLGPGSSEAASLARHAFLAATPGLSAQGAQLGVDIVQSFGGAMDTISTGTAEKVGKIALAFQAATPGLSEAARSSALQAVAPLVQGLDTLPGHGTTAMSALIGIIRAQVPGLSAASAEAAARAAVGINAIVPDFQDAGVRAGAAATTAVSASGPHIAEAGRAVGHSAGGAAASGVGEGVKSGQGSIQTAGVTTVQAALSAIDAAKLSVFVGLSFDDGIIQGMQINAGAVEIAAAIVVTRAEIAARAAAQSHSPSKLFAKVGEDLTAGLAQGIGNAQSLAVGQVRSLVEHLANQAAATVASETTSFADQASKHVAGVMDAAVAHQAGVLKTRQDALLKTAVSDSIGALGSSITHLGAAGRAGLATGSVSLQDLIQPIATSLDSAMKGWTASLNRNIDLQTGALKKTSDGLAAESIARQEALRSGKDLPGLAVSATPAAAKHITGVAELHVHVEGKPGQDPAALRAQGDILGAAAAKSAERSILSLLEA